MMRSVMEMVSMSEAVFIGGGAVIHSVCLHNPEWLLQSLIHPEVIFFEMKKQKRPLRGTVQPWVTPCLYLWAPYPSEDLTLNTLFWVLVSDEWMDEWIQPKCFESITVCSPVGRGPFTHPFVTPQAWLRYSTTQFMARHSVGNKAGYSWSPVEPRWQEFSRIIKSKV